MRSIGLLDEKSSSERVWYKRYETVKAYYEEFGDLNLAHKTVYHDFKLGIWVYNQRVQNRNGKLSEEKVARLDKIGMLWENVIEARNVRGQKARSRS